jgi:hypothetical protein
MALTLLLCQPAFAAIANSGSIYMVAEPGSWVGGGLGAPSVLWTHGDQGIMQGASNFDQGASISFDNGGYWSFDFAAPTYDPITNTNNGNPLHTGFYNNATRFPFNSPTRPGLDVSGEGRGNNTLGGWFYIWEVGYGTDGSINLLAVDFRQYDESEQMQGPSLYGSLRFNSSVALNYNTNPVPVPAAAWLFGSGLIGLISISRRKARKT